MSHLVPAGNMRRFVPVYFLKRNYRCTCGYCSRMLIEGKVDGRAGRRKLNDVSGELEMNKSPLPSPSNHHLALIFAPSARTN